VTAHPSAPGDIKYFFIRRPVMAGVIAIVITLLGLVSLGYLPVNRYPSISPPSIRITAVYPGATAEDVASAVAARSSSSCRVCVGCCTTSRPTRATA
jgi:multidrug efflux pump subunit AcrB